MDSSRSLLLSSTVLCLALSSCGSPESHLKTGDIVFQTTRTTQGAAIQEATGSPFTHCGMVFEDHGKLMVLEAVGPVKATPLKDFIAASEPGSFHAKRLKNPPSPGAVAKGSEWAMHQAGKPYDPNFRWGDDAIYCSELVWKTYTAAGVELCKPRPFRSYKLDGPIVKEIVAERYGSISRLPLNEPAVSPGDLADSPLLMDVTEAPGK